MASTEKLNIIQYMSIQRVPLLHRLVQKMLRLESTVVFDLEATLSSHDQNKSEDIKAWGRLELLTFSKNYPDLFKNRPVGIRINSLQSGELQNDLEIVSEISEIWDLDCIIGPMIYSQACIDEYLLALDKVCYKTFIPIVETIKGIGNLASIVSHPSIRKVQYGHQDFCLDAGYWPFYEQDEIEFWEIVSRFIKIIEAAGLQYIHPPASDINNESLFTQIYLRLQKLCTLPFSIVTINNQQTALFLNLKKNLKESSSLGEIGLLRKTKSSPQEKIDNALYVKKICSPKERNFMIDPKTQKFFSPHKYAAALQFLEHYNE